MVRRTRLLLVAVGMLLAIGAKDSFAQFGGRGGIFGGPSRAGRGERGGGTQSESNRIDRPIPQDVNSFEQTEHRLLLMEVDLGLEPDQKGPWQAFADKVLDYARDLAHERALAGIPPPAGTAISGLQQIEQTTDLARHRLNDLEDIRAAASALYKTLSSDQKQIADTRIMTIIGPQPNLPPGGDDTSKSSDPGSSSTRLRR